MPINANQCQSINLKQCDKVEILFYNSNMNQDEGKINDLQFKSKFMVILLW